MRIAINNLNGIEKLKGNEIIYVFNKESIDELVKTNLHCMHKDYINDIDLNLTPYDIPCIKKCTINDDLTMPEKKDYKFAIIVPNCNNDHGEYNKKTFLQNCIESILNQTYKNFELIIVDDMSTDTSVKTILNYMNKDKRIHLVENERKRYNGGSRNVGIEYALEYIDFDYFAFLDSDDWWKDNKVLETINKELYDHELMLIGLECVDKNGVFLTKFHEYDDYKDFFLSDNKVWCTAWARIIRKDKIVFFPEDSLMEDRVWSYEQADNVDISKVKNLKKVMYVWNRTNATNSVSIVRNKIWEASAWKHVGQQIMLIQRLKHKEMIPILEKRIQVCINKLNQGIYQQY